MRSRLEYLQDLVANGASTEGDAAKRLGVSSAAAAMQYKRCKLHGLAQCDESQPPSYSITEKGN